MTAVVDGIEAERRSPFGDNPVVGARGARTQRRILTAALDVFAEHGYHDSRIEQITAAAGCSRPTFYQYFSSKEDVFRALAAHVGRSVVEMTDALGPVTPDAAGRAAVVAWMRDFSDFYDGFAPVFTGFSAVVRTDRSLAGASAPVSAGFGKALRPHLVLDDGVVPPEVMASHDRHDDRAGQPAAHRHLGVGGPQALRRRPGRDRAPGARRPGPRARRRGCVRRRPPARPAYGGRSPPRRRPRASGR